MRVFLDTNILMESITNRSHSTEIARIYSLYKAALLIATFPKVLSTQSHIL